MAALDVEASDSSPFLPVRASLTASGSVYSLLIRYVIRSPFCWSVHARCCMHVCMSENLYPARLKRKRHSRTAVSNKQKRLQCPFEPFSGQVGWAQRGRETVPDPGSSDSETPITECTVGASITFVTQFLASLSCALSSLSSWLFCKSRRIKCYYRQNPKSKNNEATCSAISLCNITLCAA